MIQPILYRQEIICCSRSRKFNNLTNSIQYQHLCVPFYYASSHITSEIPSIVVSSSIFSFFLISKAFNTLLTYIFGLVLVFLLMYTSHFLTLINMIHWYTSYLPLRWPSQWFPLVYVNAVNWVMNRSNKEDIWV